MRTEWYDEFRAITFNSIGRINPKSVTENYFTKIGKDSLWNTFIENTTHLIGLNELDKLKFLEAGYFHEHPKCYCGNPTAILDRKVSKYCSAACANVSPDKAKKVSESKLSQDHTEANDKRKETMLEKYGVEYNTQREEVKEVLRKAKFSDDILDNLTDPEWMEEEYLNKKRTAVDISSELGCDYSTVLEYDRKLGFKIRRTSNYSLEQKEICEFILSENIDAKLCDWDSLVTKELDVFVPDKNLAVEMNGLIWHSVDGKKTFDDRRKHIVKIEMCNEKEINLLQFTDLQWNSKQDIVKSIIRSKIGTTDKIHARKCNLVEVNTELAKSFFRKNHLDGWATAKIYIGLEYFGEVVQIMSFGKSRFDKKYEWELIRSATTLGITVVGGMSKILSKFRKEYKGSLMTYCDRNLGTNSTYEKVGFEKLGDTQPGYFWTDAHGRDIIPRYKTTKSELSNWLEGYDKEKSESENMFYAGYRRYWTPGSTIFVMKTQ